ncbi:hypothetical protein FRC07_013071, partial [Ceratobasidium sp. 392]
MASDSLDPTPSVTIGQHDAMFPFYHTLFTNPTIYLPVSISANESLRPLQQSDAYLFAIAAFICQLIKSQSELQHLYFARRAAVRIRGELVASVYEKALRRKDITGSVQKEGGGGSGQGKGKGKKGGKPQDPVTADLGKIVSLVSSDSNRVARFVGTAQYLYDTPLSIIIAATMLYNLMGWAAFTGYIVVLLAIPINTLLVRKSSALFRGISTMRDKRMRAMNEVILAIKFIKYSAWESRWISRILKAREEELKWLQTLKLTMFSLTLVWDVVPVLVSAISFAFFTLVAKRQLTPDVAFPCITVFAMLGQSLAQLPKIANWFIISSVSLKRIEGYLNEDEVPEYVSSLKRAPLPPHAPVDGRLGYKGPKDKKPGLVGRLKAFWNVALVFARLRKAKEVKAEEVERTAEEKPFELRDVSVMFPEGALSLVYGPTGSGKSSLFSALLGEMDHVKGEIYLPKEPTRLNERTGLQVAISYCSQQPWLQHQSIKDN